MCQLTAAFHHFFAGLQKRNPNPTVMYLYFMWIVIKNKLPGTYFLMTSSSLQTVFKQVLDLPVAERL